MTTLESKIPNIGPTDASSSDSGEFKIEFEEKTEVLFLPVSASQAIGTNGIDSAKLPKRAPFMLPAVHDAEVGNLPAPLPSPQAGSVWINNTGNRLLLPGGGGIRSNASSRGRAQGIPSTT